LPDIQSYYDVRAKQYIYLDKGNWKHSRNLPNQCRRYDVNKGYKVALNDYHGNEPYTNYNDHKARYYVGYRESQRTVEYRNDNRIDYNKKKVKNSKNNRYASNSNQNRKDKNDYKEYNKR